MVIFQTKGILLQQETCLWETHSNIFMYTESSITQFVLEQQFAVQMVDAMLYPIRQLASNILNQIITSFIPILEGNCFVTRHYEFDERNNKATLLDLLLLSLGLLYDWVNIGLKIGWVTICLICMCSKMEIFINYKHSIQILYLIGSQIQHTIIGSSNFHLANFFDETSIEGDLASWQFKGEAIALLCTKDISDIHQFQLIQSLLFNTVESHQSLIMIINKHTYHSIFPKQYKFKHSNC